MHKIIRPFFEPEKEVFNTLKCLCFLFPALLSIYPLVPLAVFITLAILIGLTYPKINKPTIILFCIFACLLTGVFYTNELFSLHKKVSQKRDFIDSIGVLFVHYLFYSLFLNLKSNKVSIVVGYIYLVCLSMICLIALTTDVNQNKAIFDFLVKSMFVSVFIYYVNHYFYLFKTVLTIKLAIISCIILFLIAICVLIITDYSSNKILKAIRLSLFISIFPTNLITLIATYISKIPVEEKQLGFVWAYFLTPIGLFIAFMLDFAEAMA